MPSSGVITTRRFLGICLPPRLATSRRNTTSPFMYRRSLGVPPSPVPRRRMGNPVFFDWTWHADLWRLAEVTGILEMTSDLDIYRSAHLLIKRHGDDAPTG